MFFSFMFCVIVGLIIALMIWWVFDYGKMKQFKNGFLKVAVLIILLIANLLIVPFVFYEQANVSAYYTGNTENTENLYNMAINTALLPSVKSNMYGMLAGYYYINKDGKKALENYEKSYAVKKNDLSLSNMCILYTINRDVEKSFETCMAGKHYQLASINYILDDNYQEALKIINTEINRLDAANISCWDYATRAYIYRKLGNMNLFEKDYAMAKKNCPNYKKLNLLYKNENYYKDTYTELKKQYKF